MGKDIFRSAQDGTTESESLVFAGYGGNREGCVSRYRQDWYADCIGKVCLSIAEWSEVDAVFGEILTTLSKINW